MPNDELINVLERHIKDPMGLEKIVSQPETDLFTVGLDSMSAFALIDDLEEIGISVEFTDLLANPTAQYLDSQLRE